MLSMVLDVKEWSLLLDGNFCDSILGIVIRKKEGNLIKVGSDGWITDGNNDGRMCGYFEGSVIMGGIELRIFVAASDGNFYCLGISAGTTE